MVRTKIVLFFLMFVGYVNAQNINGKVTDLEGNPLIGASIQIENSSNGTVTNEDGDYELSNVKSGSINILVSFIGYETQNSVIKINGNTTVDFQLRIKAFMTDEVIVSSLRLGDKAPGTVADINKEAIERQNMGQDIPYILSLTPSMVTTSDAGAGVGYTNYRIRGTANNRINVTVNGIPMNDAESHGVWWVNMPDFASSLDNVQIQRGVGTSTNGAAAFGGSINMQTNKLEKEAYGEISSAGGSFNTYKNTVKVGSGLLKDHFTFDARMSKITSDGFIDRASSNLQSYFLSGAYYAENTLVRINIFSGKEKTYQAWNGVPKVRLENDYAGMKRYEEHWLMTPEEVEHMINSDSRTYNAYTYDNETDNYQQDHFQLLFSQNIAKGLTFNSALHYTYGRGYYEQYKNDQDLADYGIETDDATLATDLVRQKWLSNDFYGVVASLKYENTKIDATIGGAANKYDGRHFGNIIWGEYLGEIEKDYEWYRSTGIKSDINIYAKANYHILNSLNAYIDLQFRKITHIIEGKDDDLRDITQTHNYEFFNPKAGIYYSPSKNHEAYLLYARGHREPTRSNFTDADPNGKQPTEEQLDDFELGYTFKQSSFSIGANAYYMLYKNQLVLTGEINDVGSAIMTNVDDSYRMGIELFGGVKITDFLKWDLNFTLSKNKINEFTEYVEDWDNGGLDETKLKETDIAFSPNVIANSNIIFAPKFGLYISFQSQFVGDQFIDNSESSDRMLDQYLVNNINLSYSIPQKLISEARVNFQLNNVFNTEYENNAWVYSYIYEEQRHAMDGYFPQAGINFMLGLNLRF